ncbi:MAG TPA: TlpA disulfide reductase family protein [Chitinophagaceae bacterium]|nr:TlpA disulfide reductase family protein [Chitinophagaceae bacterium]
MKKWYPILIISLFWAGCVTPESGNFRLTVNLDNTPLQSVYLEEVAIGGNKLVDTTQIEDASGRFSFTGYVNGEGLYRIRFSLGKTIYLVLKTGKVQVSGNYNQLDHLAFQGSPGSTDLNRFIQTMARMNSAIRELALQYDSLKQAGISDTLLTQRTTALDDSADHQVALIDQFARQTSSAVCAVFALGLLKSDEDLLAAKGIFDSLKMRFPLSKLADSALNEYDLYMNNNGVTVKVKQGQEAPGIQLPDPSGKLVSLQSFRGKYVLVDFWASWCEPCRQENPNVVREYDKFRKKGFTILGVSLDSRKAAWTEAIRQDGLTWEEVSDLKGWDSKPAADYGVEAIPANFLLDPQGRVVAINLRGDDLDQELSNLLK